MDILYIVTTSQGGGDIAFACNLFRELVESGRNSIRRLAALVCAQSSTDPNEMIRRFQRDVELVPGNVDACIIGASRRHDDAFAMDAAASSALINWLTSLPVGTSLRVVQGPLKLFHEAKDAQLCLDSLDDAVRGRSLDYGLLTIREFGQSAFCSPCMRPCNVDLSSGLGDDEVGIFRLPPPEPLTVLPTALLGSLMDSDGGSMSSPLPYFVGYYRTPKHGLQFSRLILAGLASRLMRTTTKSDTANAATVAVTRAVVLASFDSVTAECSQYVSAILTGLRCHPWVSSANLITSTDDASTNARITVELNSAQQAIPLCRILEVDLIDVFSLCLPLHQFRSLLAHCDGAVVTGDATLNEALAFGVPFWYSTEGHKIFVQRSLSQLIASSAEPRLVGWQAFVSPLNTAGESARWADLLQLGLDGVRDSFQCWSRSVMGSRGTLGEAVVNRLKAVSTAA